MLPRNAPMSLRLLEEARTALDRCAYYPRRLEPLRIQIGAQRTIGWAVSPTAP
jgi:hypothetical protein